MRVFIASPYKGNIGRNLQYVKLCCLDSCLRGEHPFAPHAFYTQFLDDSIVAQREYGMLAGRDWLKMAEFIAVYNDFGMSSGMQDDLDTARMFGLDYEFRELPSHMLEIIK